MNTVPFAQNLLLWRRARGLTQSELARRARVPQPNLSGIERGAHEVSLDTLRALAAALGVRPGLLVDGVPPAPAKGVLAALPREALERIAAAAAGRRTALRRGEGEIVALLRPLVRQRLNAVGQAVPRIRGGGRAAQVAWLTLHARYPRAVLESLLQRITDQAAQP